MDQLPVEVLVNIVDYLQDDADLVSVRQACKALCNAVRMIRRPLQWPKGAEDTSLVPWRPSKLYVTQFTPLNVPLFGTVVAVSHHNRLSFEHVQSLTLENIYEDMDLSSLVQLTSLILSCNITEETTVILPPNVENLSLYDVLTEVSLAPCVKLRNFSATSSVFTNWNALAGVEKCVLNRIDVLPGDVHYLVNIKDLSLKLCSMPAPPALNSTVLKCISTQWVHYPEMPQVKDLEVYESEMPVLRIEDLNRCTKLTLCLALRPGNLQVTCWDTLRELRLNFDFNWAYNAIDNGNRVAVHQLPNMPQLEYLQLSNCGFTLPAEAPNLRTIMVSRMTRAVTVTRFPKLKYLMAHNIYDNLTVDELPELIDLRITFSDCSISLSRIPKLQTLFMHNMRPNVVQFAFTEMPDISKVSLVNVEPLYLQRLCNAREITFDNCVLLSEELPQLGHVANLSFVECRMVDNAALFTNAIMLDVSSTNVTDVSMLSRVRELVLNYCHLDAWHGLSSLHTLHINFTNVTDLSPLAHHNHLVHLSCCNTNINDLRPLRTIKTLRTFLASNCLRLIDANALDCVANIDLSDCYQLKKIRRLRSASNIDVRGCINLPRADVEYLRQTVPFVHWEDVELTETDEFNEAVLENDGDQH